MSKKICWITWEDHRRSIELAREIGGSYYFIDVSEIAYIKYFLKALKTVSIILKNRKGIVIVQNPSRILAALASLMKLIFGFPLIVDRHTNFRLEKGATLNPAEWFVIICSEFSLKVADLTIVTNDFLKELVIKKGGRALVLHDKMPKIEVPKKKVDLPSGSNILFVCTFAPDEPFSEVISSARILGSDFNIHITGNYKKAGLETSASSLPENVHLLGFVSNEDYEAHMYSCDVILVLTTAEWVIVCGGYEAVALGKPLITSNTKALKEFFQGKALHTNSDACSIAEAIRIACEDNTVHSTNIQDFYILEEEVWQAQWERFLEVLASLGRS